MSSPTPAPHPPNRRLAPYIDALKSLSVKTRTPLPSLVASFAILHEGTAILPLVSIFFAARSLGIGERVVLAVQETTKDEDNWAKETMREWMDEGEKWAGRVGRRYGWFGFEKGSSVEKEAGMKIEGTRIAGDVANAVFAYGVTKALLPLRIGLSLYLSPAFSRRILQPLTNSVMRTFKR